MTTPSMISINAPHFCAGACVVGGTVAAPIAPIIRYMTGWPIERVRAYCRAKRWELWEFATTHADRRPPREAL